MPWDDVEVLVNKLKTSDKPLLQELIEQSHKFVNEIVTYGLQKHPIQNEKYRCYSI